jgi:hypothetical protein
VPVFEGVERRGKQGVLEASYRANVPGVGAVMVGALHQKRRHFSTVSPQDPLQPDTPRPWLLLDVPPEHPPHIGKLAERMNVIKVAPLTEESNRLGDRCDLVLPRDA